MEALVDNPSFGEENINRLKGLWADFTEKHGEEITKILEDISTNDVRYTNQPWQDMYLSDRRKMLTKSLNLLS